MRSFFSNKEQI